MMTKTILKDRELWYDGTSRVNPDMVPSLILLGVPIDKIAVNKIDEDIEKFNQLSDHQISTESPAIDASFDWQVPQEFSNIDLLSFCTNKLKLSNRLSTEYTTRLSQELREISTRKQEKIMCTLIYLVDTLREKQLVWGVGRGSSCASLVLHLIGIHEVDPVKYEIPMSEFFHD